VVATLVGIALTFNMHFRDQRAGCINYGKTALRRAILDGAGDTVRAENGDGAGWDFVDFIDEICAFRAQPLNDMPVVNDFMTHIDRRPIFFEGALDDLDRSFDPGAEASGLG
jgi:hypothetical protein